MMKKKKNIIGALLIVIFVMIVGYAAFASQLTLNGTVEIVSEWNVRITGISAQYVSDNCSEGNPQFTDTSITFNAELTKPGDYITYLITIENAGTFNAVLDNITFTADENGSPAIDYSYSEPHTSLAPGEQTYMLVHVRYKEDATEMPSIKSKTITGTIEYVQE